MPSHGAVLAWAFRNKRFNAALYPGYYFDLDADRIAQADASLVSTWDDVAGNRDVSAAGALRPTFRTAGWNASSAAVQYNGSNGMASAVNLDIGTFTAYVVCQLSGTAGMLYEHGPDGFTSSGSYLYGTTGATMSVNRGAVTAKDRAVNWATTNTRMVVCQRFDGTHAGHLLYISSLTAAATSNVSTGNPGVGIASRAINIGARTGGTSLRSTGFFKRVLIYTPALGLADFQAVMNGLGGLYGVTITP